MMSIWKRKRGCVARLTALTAAVPVPGMLPTIIMSTIDTRLVSVSSMSDGHAIRMTSL